jgi:hypothetical protein
MSMSEQTQKEQAIAAVLKRAAIAKVRLPSFRYTLAHLDALHCHPVLAHYFPHLYLLLCPNIMLI